MGVISWRSMTATPMWPFPGAFLACLVEDDVHHGLAGLGIITAPLFMVEQHLATDALRPVLREWATDKMPLYVVYPPNRHLSTKLRIFVDWAAELFAGNRARPA